jgi:hemerythrin-like domain-containing protein
MDAITLLRNDHRTVEQLFKRFEKAGDEAYVAKREIVDRIIEELSVHAVIEEQLFYPAARATVPGVEDIALESIEEHHIVKWVLSELDGMAPQDERFDAKVTVLIENVRHHVEEEQDEFFPKVRDELGRKALNELGDAMAEAKATAPTHPHPRAPDTPPANAIIGNVTGVVDRISDNISGLAQGTVSATQDLIARLTNSKRPKTSPTGNSVARKRAQSTRAASGEAADTVAKTARRAVKATTDTTRAATSGAKAVGKTAASTTRATATTAKRSAKETVNTAKRSAKATTTTAKQGARQTTTTAKRAASTTGSTAKKSAKATASTAKRGAKQTATAARTGRTS